MPDRYRREVKRIIEGEPDAADVMRATLVEAARLVAIARSDDQLARDVVDAIDRLLRSEAVVRAVADT